MRRSNVRLREWLPDGPGGQVVREAWLEVRLDDDGAPGWIAAYRVVPVDGRPVIAEVRLFPAEPRRDPGRWSAETLGSGATVPLGGLPFAAVRALKPSKHLHATWPQVVNVMRKVAGGAPLERQGFTEPAQLPPRRPGRRGHDDLFYASWAERYERAASSSRRPIRVLVEEFEAEGRSFTDGYVRDVVHRARKRGFLTGEEPGRGVGKLTPKARRVLAAQARRSAASRRGEGRK
jgi:hypothetical protein